MGVVRSPLPLWSTAGGRDRDLIVRVAAQRLDDRVDALGAHAVVVGHENAQHGCVGPATAAFTTEQRDREAKSKEKHHLESVGSDHARDGRNKVHDAQ